MAVVNRAIGNALIPENTGSPTNTAATAASPAAIPAVVYPEGRATAAPNAPPLIPTAVALTLPRAAGARAAQAIAASCSTATPRFMGVGDSIVAKLVDSHAVDGQRSPENTPSTQGKSTQDGRLPSEVFAWIEAQPPGTFAGKHIILSTGATNTQRMGSNALSPQQQAQEMALVQRQIQALVAAGAASVTVLGVGNSITNAKNLDRQLRAAALTGGASYTGPLEGTDGGRWHPKDPAAPLRQAQKAYVEKGC